MILCYRSAMQSEQLGRIVGRWQNSRANRCLEGQETCVIHIIVETLKGQGPFEGGLSYEILLLWRIGRERVGR